ncbi:MAG: hypothetical protein E7K04_01815 [Helicobacter sp.]|nr:hypothetical protein [Helicobacter sp.]
MSISPIGNITYINQNAQNLIPQVPPNVTDLNINNFNEKHFPKELKSPEEIEKTQKDGSNATPQERPQEEQEEQEEQNLAQELELAEKNDGDDTAQNNTHMLDILA